MGERERREEAGCGGGKTSVPPGRKSGGARIRRVAQREEEFKPASMFVDALSAGSDRESRHFPKNMVNGADAAESSGRLFRFENG